MNSYTLTMMIILSRNSIKGLKHNYFHCFTTSNHVNTFYQNIKEYYHYIGKVLKHSPKVATRHHLVQQTNNFDQFIISSDRSSIKAVLLVQVALSLSSLLALS